ncbi:ASCH domain-containing protein [Erwinia sp. CGal63]|uniref:ASCH domain-containing protein n=1 Tax=Erwinia sp. CGal63 TaxID=2919889 RepID=UPI00300BAA05
MKIIAALQKKYPDSQAWSFGDSPEMADELAALVAKGVKTASCSSYTSYSQDRSITPGSYHIILDGQNAPVCVIRIIAMSLVRFNDVTAEQAYKEGEGDRSLRYWRQAHREFFERAGCWAEEMELITEEFRLVETL